MSEKQPQDNMIRLFTLASNHSCSYLPNLEANSVFLDHEAPPNWQQYCQLSKLGFRRSGNHYYRPNCPSCQACQSCRIQASNIQLQKGRFRRILKKAQDLTLSIAPAQFSSEHYLLFERYINERHQDGDMYPPSEKQFRDFLCSKLSFAHFVELRDSTNKLLACTATDLLDDGLSAIYTFFDPDHAKLSPGSLMILLLCKMAQQKQLEFVYLGYWVKDSQKMQYKSQFTPLELFDGEIWHLLESNAS